MEALSRDFVRSQIFDDNKFGARRNREQSKK